jgi:hypothetical protein
MQADLFLFGVKTEGIVTGSQWVNSHSIRYRSRSTYAIVQFKAENQIVVFYAPQNVNYRTGEKVEILYDKNDPGNHLLLDIWGIYLNASMIISALLSILWIGIYRSLNLQKAEQELILGEEPLE